MKHQLYITVILIICISHLSSFAQDPFDCIDATIVCDNSDLELDYADIVGNVTEEIDDFCYSNNSITSSFLDNNTIWLKYQFLTGGDFYFTISSAIPNTDIDFVVFNSSTNSCADLEAIRCMFTGNNPQGDTDPICLGPTGLSPNSTDTYEEPNCFSSDDNFLAAIEVDAGDILYLAIVNFTFDFTQYTITHGGNAEISCLPVGLAEIDQNEVNIFPNPTDDVLQIEVANNQDQLYKLDLFNTAGEKVLTRSLTTRNSIDISNLTKGIYYAKVWTSEQEFFYKRIVKI